MGKSLIIAPVVQGTSLIKLLATITEKIDTMPKNGPKNAPAMGAKKSKRVKETLEPSSLLKGTCKLVNPTRVKIAKNSNFFCKLLDIRAQD
ncbi:TPA: hypothetical protein DEP06_05975 [Candidatus Daviesbacteria bacterium]|nr:hypothetical protein [Candidatus Daviesbacteria bacterium]